LGQEEAEPSSRSVVVFVLGMESLEMLTVTLVPKYVFWVDGYPKTASGKIQKFKLKQRGIGWLQEGKGLV
jgi:acyl-coenzyme A synthetase/AMP-(fatty) acid ligase